MKGIIFDCDGVLVDTEILFSKGSNDHMRALGIKLDDEDEVSFAGMTMKHYCETIIAKYQLKASLDDFINEEWHYAKPYFADEKLKPMPKLLEFLKSAKNYGIKMSIASSSSQEYVQHILDLFKINQYFDFVISGDMVKFSKPHPDIYLMAIERMRLPIDDLFVIEDSVSGILAAKTAGLFVIGYKGSELVQNTSLADKEVFSYDEIDLLKLMTNVIE